jgi:Ca2+-binding EF-hand superfamily protein
MIRATTGRLAVLLLCLGFAAPAVCAESDLPATAAARFDFLDANRDGMLSKYEYDSDVAFETMDSDGDARLSAAELQAILGAAEGGMPTASDRIVIADLDGDGALDDAELRRATEMRFSWLDRNRDGNLDLDEMKAGFGVRVRP